MTEGDFDDVLEAMWKSVRGSGNTRSKVGQVPRILISLTYKKGVEFQFGNLSDYVKLTAVDGKDAKVWSSPEDYTVDLSLLCERLSMYADKIESVSYAVSPDMKLSQDIPVDWENLKID